MISPVWLQVLRRTDQGGYVLGGEHDIDIGWVRDVRRAGGNHVKSMFNAIQLPVTFLTIFYFSPSPIHLRQIHGKRLLTVAEL